MNPRCSSPRSALTRRDFLGRTLATSAGIACGQSLMRANAAADASGPSIVVFSKVYQELKLGFEDAAALTAEAGLNGVDCPLRPGGEILPERAAEDLPRYVEILRNRNLQLPLLTTAITSTAPPHTETIVRTAKKVGISYYRLGFITRERNVPAAKQIGEVRAQLKDVAALNKEVGICALLQNHSPAGKTTYFGGDLSELVETVQGFDPAQVGVAFDIGHALLVHGDEWRRYFERLRPHFKIAYVKDAQRGGRWVPFGKGDIAGTGYFRLLRQMGYNAPISMHIEYDWSEQGAAKNRATLLQVLKDSSRLVRQWLAA